MSVSNDTPPMTTFRGNFFGQMARSLLARSLRQMLHTGTVAITLPDGGRLVIGQGLPRVALKLHDWRTVFRLATNPNLAAGESYMDGRLTMERGDIYDLLDLCMINFGQKISRKDDGLWARLRFLGRRLMMNNPVGRAQKNVAHHYDLSDELFELFLDEQRQYSCAYFAEPDMSLDEAQEAKISHIANKLQLRPGQRLLDIGSGWGGLGLALAEKSGVDVTGVTLSVEQQRYAEADAQSRDLSDQVRFKLLDYRKLSGRFDRIVSVGMFEHVGAPRYQEYFDKVAKLLKDDGVALIHTIASLKPPSTPHPWIRKYIFPGGYIPSLSEITPAIENSGLVVGDIEVLRLHYADTLRVWRQRFLQNWDKAAALYDQRFCRMWEFYLASCEAGFRHNGLVVVQIQLSKNQQAVPLVRDYMYGNEPVS